MKQIENLQDQKAFEVGIGYAVSQLLNLKVSKVSGRINTSWGNKTIQGLGACILRIIEEETERLK